MLKTGGPQPPTTRQTPDPTAATSAAPAGGRAPSAPQGTPLGARQGSRSTGTSRPRIDFVPPQRPPSEEATTFTSPPGAVADAVALTADSRLSDVLPLLQKGTPGQVLAAHRRQVPGGGETVVLKWENRRAADSRSRTRAAEAVTDLTTQEWRLAHDVVRPEAHRAIYRSADRFDAKADGFSAMVLDHRNVRVFLREASAIGRQVSESLAPGMVPLAADALRAPADLSAHWIDAIDQMRPAILQIADRQDPRVVAFGRLLDSARRDWMAAEHLEPVAGAAYFAECRSICDAAGLEELSRLAGHLQERHARLLTLLPITGMPQDHERDLESRQALFALARGNAASRVWESALMTALVADPPPAMLHATAQLGERLADHLASMPPESLLRVANSLRRRIRDHPRHWSGECPASIAFTQADARIADQALLTLLRTPPAKGVECHAIYHLLPRLTGVLADKAPEYGTWSNAAIDRQDERHISAIRSRQERPVPSSTGSGLLLLHQPPRPNDPYKDTRSENIRPAVAYVPGDPVHPATLSRQMHGHTYVGDVSSSMLATGKLIGTLNAQAANDGLPPIDARYALLGEIAFLVDDGGHAIHEALFALDMIRERFDFGLVPPRTTPGPFMPDRRYFLDALVRDAEPETVRCLESALTTAFHDMIAYRRQHVQAPAA